MPQVPRLFLILDDEESIRQSIAAFMEDEGYTVFQAESSEQALEIVKKYPIDEAVVDIRLPGHDGNTFMLEARKIRPRIKFVVHTGSADYIPPKAIQALGVTRDKVLIKPASDLNVICNALKD
ncbi:MAG: response regulator [Proteobacteria bacterium]|nr:response regulator [Desulfobacula sp.]MBU3953770.1 response regulator [Pseudomonadota bacterium]MBU4130834.1 response regulator [Pseudomonadota bacterium]